MGNNIQPENVVVIIVNPAAKGVMYVIHSVFEKLLRSYSDIDENYLEFVGVTSTEHLVKRTGRIIVKERKSIKKKENQKTTILASRDGILKRPRVTRVFKEWR